VWRVQVYRENSMALEGDSTSVVTTNYATPVISSIVRTDGGTTNSLPTEGGTQIAIGGTNFGPKGTQLEGYYGSALGTEWYCATECIVTVASTKATCNTRSGIGQQHVWKFEIKDHGWLGSPSDANEASTTTSYGLPTISEVHNEFGGQEFSTHGT